MSIDQNSNHENNLDIIYKDELDSLKVRLDILEGLHIIPFKDLDAFLDKIMRSEVSNELKRIKLKELRSEHRVAINNISEAIFSLVEIVKLED